MPGELPTLELLKTAVREQLGTTVLPAQTLSSLTSWKPNIEVMLGRGAGPRAIFDALKLRPKFTESLAAANNARADATSPVVCYSSAARDDRWPDADHRHYVGAQRKPPE